MHPHPILKVLNCAQRHMIVSLSGSGNEAWRCLSAAHHSRKQKKTSFWSKLHKSRQPERLSRHRFKLSARLQHHHHLVCSDSSSLALCKFACTTWDFLVIGVCLQNQLTLTTLRRQLSISHFLVWQLHHARSSSAMFKSHCLDKVHKSAMQKLMLSAQVINKYASTHVDN